MSTDMKLLYAKNVSIEMFETPNGFKYSDMVDSLYAGRKVRDRFVVKLDMLGIFKKFIGTTLYKEYRDTLWTIASGNINLMTLEDKSKFLSGFLMELTYKEESFNDALGYLIKLCPGDSTIGDFIIDYFSMLLRGKIEEYENFYVDEYSTICDSYGYFYIGVKDEEDAILCVEDYIDYEVISNAKNWTYSVKYW